MNHIEAMKQALDALEYAQGGNTWTGEQSRIAITALRQALEQPEQVSVPEGWKLVPVEPTDAMLSVPVNIDLRECVTPGGVTGLDAVGLFNAWEAMIEAAPQPWDTSDMAYRPGGLSMEQEGIVPSDYSSQAGDYSSQAGDCLEQEPVAWWNPDESGLAFQRLRGDWQPLYAAPVHPIDTSEKRVDETAKDEHEPDVYGDGNVYRGQRSKDSETKTLHLLREENAKLWGWVNELSQKRNPTTPPKREWVGLTDAEIFDVIRSLCADNETAQMLIHVSMDEYRAIEAKLKEKNT